MKTAEQAQEEFANDEPHACPFCNESERVRYGAILSKHNYCWRENECYTCGAQWSEVYRYVGLDNIILEAP